MISALRLPLSLHTPHTTKLRGFPASPNILENMEVQRTSVQSPGLSLTQSVQNAGPPHGMWQWERERWAEREKRLLKEAQDREPQFLCETSTLGASLGSPRVEPRGGSPEYPAGAPTPSLKYFRKIQSGGKKRTDWNSSQRRYYRWLEHFRKSLLFSRKEVMRKCPWQDMLEK